MTGIYRSATLKKTAIHFVHSVKDSRGALIGYIVARMPVEGLYEIVKQSVGIYDGKDFSFELLDGKGHILYSDGGNSDGLKSVSLDWKAISGMISRGKAQGSIRHGTGKRPGARRYSRSKQSADSRTSRATDGSLSSASPQAWPLPPPTRLETR